MGLELELVIPCQKRTLHEQQQQQQPLFLFCRTHIHSIFHIVSRFSYIVLLASASASASASAPASAFPFLDTLLGLPSSPQASSTHGNFMPPDYLGHRRYIPWSRVGRTREESKKSKQKEKSPSLTIEQRNQPHQRELQQRQPPSSSQHQPRKFR